MNWYKKAQYSKYPSWLSEQMAILTNNFKKTLDKQDELAIPKIEKWFKETNPNTDNLSFHDAAMKAIRHDNDKYPEDSIEQIKRNMNAYYSEKQNINPNGEDFAVDIRGKGKSIPNNIKRKINNALHDLGNFHVDIPLHKIFDICKSNNVVAIQEDGVLWGGLLLGNAECGSEKASKQHVIFTLAMKNENGEYILSNNGLSLSWCKMSSGKYEIVTYVG